MAEYINYGLLARVIDGDAPEICDVILQAVCGFLTYYDPGLDDVRAELIIPVIETMRGGGVTGRMCLIAWAVYIDKHMRCLKRFMSETPVTMDVDFVRGQYFESHVYDVMVRAVEIGKVGVYESMLHLYGRMRLQGQIYEYRRSQGISP